MVRRTKDEALETRHRILDVAERVFSERGVTRTSLADIAKAAGVTRGAVYWHFTDKADLFCNMFARVVMPMELPVCQTDHRAATDPLASIRTMMISMLRWTSEDPQARRVFHIVFHKCEHVDEMEPVWQRINDMRANCLRQMEGGLLAAVEKGQLPDSLNIKQAAIGLRALVDGLVSDSVLDPEPRVVPHDAECLVDMYLNALNAQPVRRRAKLAA